jgi:hypothetical protein
MTHSSSASRKGRPRKPDHSRSSAYRLSAGRKGLASTLGLRAVVGTHHQNARRNCSFSTGSLDRLARLRWMATS